MNEEENTEQGSADDRPRFTEGNESTPVGSLQSETMNLSAEVSAETDDKQETADMETHAGHLHKAPGNKFWHYFFEFFMLFLAVSAGFFVENIREHYVEHQRAKVLAQSLYEDIKKDTAALRGAIIFSDKKLIAYDTVIAMLHRPRNEWNDTNFYRSIVFGMTAYPFIPTDGTYSQMKASGSLRYFKQSMVNTMNAYDVQLKKTEYRDNVEDKGLWILAPFNLDMINLEAISDIRFNKPITHEMYINIADKSFTDKFINLIMMNKAFRIRTLMEYKEQLKIADKLIEAIQKEYHPE